MGSIADILTKGGFWVAVIAVFVFLLGQFFLGEDMMSRLETFQQLWIGCAVAFGRGFLLKYTGKMRLGYSKKKCIRCSKPSVMGSIYCDFHRKQAAKEFAMDKGVLPPPDEDDENLGY